MAQIFATESLAPGFADPVHDSQASFRAALAAFARPGRIERVPVSPGIAAPGSLGRAATAFALALLDLDTPLWLSPSMSGAAGYLRFHCGCPVVAEPRKASFAIAGGDVPALDGFDLGTDEFPDRTTTLIICVESLRTGGAVTLSGPGIQETASLSIEGLPAGFWQQRVELQAMFPRGVDIVFACGDELAALPRSTRIKEA